MCSSLTIIKDKPELKVSGSRDIAAVPGQACVEQKPVDSLDFLGKSCESCMIIKGGGYVSQLCMYLSLNVRKKPFTKLF